MFRSLLGSRLRSLVTAMARTRSGRYAIDHVVDAAVNRTRQVTHGGVQLTLAVPNRLNESRVDTFAVKEPETLEWIDAIPRDAVLWDVGANIGLYSCYAAAARHCRVFAFEPSVFNLELLSRNVFLNRLTDRVTIIPLPLTDTLGVSTLHMTSMDWGGALSTFGHLYGHDGAPMKPVFMFNTIGLSMTDAVERLEIAQPDYLKIDVDGIEHLICRGGQRVLRNVRSVLLEVDEQFEDLREETARLLTDAGLQLRERRHSALVAASPYHTSYNQIWHRTTG